MTNKKQSKLLFLTKEGLRKKFTSKAFKIVNLLLLIAIPLLINIDSVIKYFGGDFDEATNIYVIDETDSTYETFEAIFNETGKLTLSEGETLLSKSDKTKEELTQDIEENESKDIIIEITSSENTIEAEILSYEYIDTMLYQSLVTSLNTAKQTIALENSDLDQEELAKIYESVVINRLFIDEELNEEEEFLDTIGSVLIPILIVPFFLLIVYSIQMVGAEINEEKSSKSMEIIISSVSPKTHFLSKIFSINIFVIVQMFLLVAFGAIGLYLRIKLSDTSLIDSFGSELTPMLNTFMSSDLLSTIIQAIPLIIILFILSFIAYSCLAGILASMTTSIEDYQQLQTPMMLITLVGYYLAIMASTFQNATFITVFSMVPFISLMLAPVLLITGQIGLIEIIIAIVLVILVILFFLKYGMRIYKAGILNYSSNKLWKKMFKSMKGKD